MSLAASRQSPVKAGTEVVFVATPQGCSDAQFRFSVDDSSGPSGTVTRDWDFAASWTWSTYTTHAGRYLVRADVRELGRAAPAASTYLAFSILAVAPPTVATCRLPVSGALPGSGGFIQMPGGAFTADAESQVPSAGQPDVSGLRRGLTYDPVHGGWLPVPRDWVMPDYSSYIYVGTEYPHVSNQPALHLVKLPSGVDSTWINGDQLYGHPIALRPEGAYGAPGPQIITLVDPAGSMSNVDQGHYGLYAVISDGVIWAPVPDLSSVQRIDVKTGGATDWDIAGPRRAIVPLGLDADGRPIVALGKQLANGEFVASEIWLLFAPSTGRPLYNDEAHPLTIVGWPIVSAGAIWIETDKGLWLEDSPTAQMRLVSSKSGYIAGGCL